MPWSRHLGDARLHDCYFAARTGEAADPLAADHLAECSRCAARYRDLAAILDRVHSDGVAETDAVFTPERLAAQQHQIARRLDLLGHAARVITFPGRLAGDAAPAARAGAAAVVSSRWLAASAAAGLFVGAVVGSMYDSGVRTPQSAPAVATAARPAPQPPAATAPPASLARPVSVSSDDEAFLSQIELALGGPRTRELQPFDAMTPRVQEISTRLR